MADFGSGGPTPLGPGTAPGPADSPKEWVHFEANETQCFDPNDKVRMLGIIDQHAGGIAGFNLQVTKLLQNISSQLSKEQGGNGNRGGSLRLSGDSLRLGASAENDSAVAEGPPTATTIACGSGDIPGAIPS